MGWAGTYRALGPKGFASYGFSRLTERLPGISYRRYQIIAVPRAGMPAMPRGHETRELAADELAATAGALDLAPATIAFRGAQGMTCLGAFRGGRLLGATWLTERPFDEDEVFVRFVPPPGAAWDTGLYVRPAERAGRAFAALWAGTGAWLDQRELGWSMSRINDYNDASWRAHQRMGAQRIDRLTALRVGNRQWLFGARPRLARVAADVHPPLLLLPMPEATP
ncbi:MAG: hypothetical protein Q7J32_10560 [Sphingomonadaceae bacterium]|nr:hypothetical protein [Sphingomonadaceae bacterium]